ncbi:MAG: RDD family protein [Deltaproteobacteria bacterium]|nr:RDD family protein [Deltaproteobacteria bacterium]
MGLPLSRPESPPAVVAPPPAAPVQAAISPAADVPESGEAPGNGAAHELLQIIVDRELTLAPVWRRIVGGLIDLIAIGAVAAMHLVLALGRLPSDVGPARGTGFDRLIDAMIIYRGATIPSALVFFALLIAYQTVSVALLGRTPGMWALRLRVISLRYQRVRWDTALTRATVAALGLLLLGIGWSLLFVDRRRRTLHDHVARTMVGDAVDKVTAISRLRPPAAGPEPPSETDATPEAPVAPPTDPVDDAPTAAP